MATAARPPLTLNVADSARATGLSTKAIRRRIERGTLPSVLVGGHRRIEVSALVDAGLLITGLERGARGAAPGQVQPDAIVQRMAGHRRRLADELAISSSLDNDVRRFADQLRRERSRSRELAAQLATANARIALLERALRGAARARTDGSGRAPGAR
jgi:hypothetical protein